ncbi:MAG: sulfur carrier protein ThiS [Gemmatimonadetes bacterium]|nr:sulfur carrier protein ThiS [Gemmatimonadota bacterium]
MAETIEIRLNGDAKRIAAGLTVAALLRELGLEPQLVVVEHNREILERSRYDATPVRAGDVLELVHFVGGG